MSLFWSFNGDTETTTLMLNGAPIFTTNNLDLREAHDLTQAIEKLLRHEHAVAKNELGRAITATVSRCVPEMPS